MKKTSFKLIVFLLVGIISVNSSFSQNSFDASATLESSELVFGNLNLEDLKNVEADNLLILEDEDFKSIDYYDDEVIEENQAVAFAKSMVALGAGLGLADSQTLWCLHAGYYFMVSQFARSALYAVASLAYEGASLSGGDVKQNLVDFSLKLLMFTSISQYAGWNLIWGVLAAYAFGSEKFEGFKNDLTRFTIAAVVGFHFLITSRLAIALTTNVLAYTNLTIKPESGGDIELDDTLFLLNKASIFTLSLLFTL